MMIRLLAAFCTLPLPLWAEIPRVMTDIAPIHSLTAQVMGDLGAPDVLLPPGADPHDFSLRPSDATRLGDADIVIWVGHGLTPWLEEPLETLAPQAAVLELLETAGWGALDVRDTAKDDDHHDAAHDDHHDHDHDHGDVDPHAWLDPATAQVWVGIIATQLATVDPENADVYMRNADMAQDALSALEGEIAAKLTGLTGQPYILPHDGYQYFEARFGLTPSAAIAGIDARAPGPAQVAVLRDQMAQDDVSCVFSDAEIGDRWAVLVTEGTDARTAWIDGVGVGLNAGPDLYPALLTRLGTAFASCLGG